VNKFAAYIIKKRRTSMKKQKTNGTAMKLIALTLALSFVLGMGIMPYTADDIEPIDIVEISEELVFDEEGYAEAEYTIATTAAASDAATLLALLNDNVTTVINVTGNFGVPGNVVLQRDKTIIFDQDWITLSGNITGGNTITVSSVQDSWGGLSINGTFDCSFVALNASIGFSNSSSVLGLNRTITAGDAGGNVVHL
jgi:hypothetical protein